MMKERAILGAVREYRFQNSELWVDCGDPHMRVTFLKPELVRVRIVPGGDFAPRNSWDAALPDKYFKVVPLELQQTQHALFLHSNAFTVRVDKDTALVEMLTPDGKSFFADSVSPVWEVESFHFTKRIEAGEAYFGFGERGGRMEKQGQTMTNWATDPGIPHGAFVDPMYMAVPVYLVVRPDACYGVYVNSTRRSSFDLSHPGELRFEAQGDELDVYIAYGPQPLDVLAHISELLGRMPLPPKWALGYHQSRWSYGSETDVRQIAATLREKQIPCDVIHLDIDYMDGYRVFTWDAERFPNPQQLIADLKEQGYRVATIIDPGVKVDARYPVYRDGQMKNMFIHNSKGKLATGYVWPDESVFPDFSRADVREWWGNWQDQLLAAGVSGIWNDMNEPALFEKPFSQGSGLGITLPLDAPQGSESEKTTHAVIHNLYGSLMAQASYEGARVLRPNERTFHLCRSGFAGIQRWTTSWMGDNGSCWEHLEMSMGQLLNMGASAIPFVGVDIGGFFGNATPELFARWMQIGSLYPFSRGHSCAGTDLHEPWVFGEEVEAISREYLTLRYRLLPYFYSVFQRAAERGYPIWRALYMHYPNDPQTYHISDQVLIGRYLMAAPILHPGQRARQVYLPQGTWYDWWEGTRYEGGRYILADAPLERMPLFVRAGAILPLGPEMQFSGEKALDPLTLHLFPGEDGMFTLYEDDGISMEYQQGLFSKTRCHLSSDEKQATLTIDARSGTFAVAERQIHVVLRDGRQYQQKTFTDNGEMRTIQFDRE
ncbi:MAG: alpha-glucosidase [Chloroflexi bacterium HGW-Chloroflexi-10]|nr:MAG: alpha-glucosidase [Chloroflexi bacterium HGW-Chloroflexi-10]